MSTEPGTSPGILSGMVVSGVIATVIALVVTYLLSLAMPLPWDLNRTLVCVAIATFSGAAVSFQRGHSLGRGGR